MKWIIITAIAFGIGGLLFYLNGKQETSSTQQQLTKKIVEIQKEKEEVAEKVNNLENEKHANERREFIQNWKDRVTVSGPGNTTNGIFGGFENVDIRLFNGTDHTIDQVTVLLSNRGGLSCQKIKDTQNLTFEDIKPRTYRTIKYSFKSGQCLNLTIEEIECSELEVKIKN